jgi:hypothetical protein
MPDKNLAKHPTTIRRRDRRYGGQDIERPSAVALDAMADETSKETSGSLRNAPGRPPPLKLWRGKEAGAPGCLWMGRYCVAGETGCLGSGVGDLIPASEKYETL